MMYYGKKVKDYDEYHEIEKHLLDMNYDYNSYNEEYPECERDILSINKKLVGMGLLDDWDEEYFKSQVAWIILDEEEGTIWWSYSQFHSDVEPFPENFFKNVSKISME